MEPSKDSNTNKAAEDLAKVTLEEEDDDETVEQPIDNEPTATKTAEEVGLEVETKDNELLSKDQTWDTLGVRPEIKEALFDMNFNSPSKIQSTTFPLIMKTPVSHLIAQAKNGAGKTGAFGLGVISRLDETLNTIQAIIFAHTLELVNQIETVLAKMAKKTKLKVTALHSSDKNKEAGHIVIITPGHFDTCFLKKKQYKLDQVKMIVFDEADYMFTNEVTLQVAEKTLKQCQDKDYKIQYLFFSATFTKDNFKTIKKYIKKANIIEIQKEQLTLTNVHQRYYKVDKREDKVNFIKEYLSRVTDKERVIIFVNSRKFVVNLREKLIKEGYKVFILMGGDMDPQNRIETIKRFNKGEIQILITTNVLARGYDERLINLVINFDMPVKIVNNKKVADVENYLHRIGRTGRFGDKGVALNLIAGEKDMLTLKQVEEYYKTKMEEIKSLDQLFEEMKKYLFDD